MQVINATECTKQSSQFFFKYVKRTTVCLMWISHKLRPLNYRSINYSFSFLLISSDKAHSITVEDKVFVTEWKKPEWAIQVKQVYCCYIWSLSIILTHKVWETVCRCGHFDRIHHGYMASETTVTPVRFVSVSITSTLTGCIQSEIEKKCAYRMHTSDSSLCPDWRLWFWAQSGFVPDRCRCSTYEYRPVT